MPSIRFSNPLRLYRLCLCGLIMLLAACSGNPTAAPTLDTSLRQNPTVAPTVDNSTLEPTATPLQREYATDQATLPAPGTPIAAVTEDANAGKVFDSLLFVRTGGIAGQTLTIQLLGDGTLTRDGVSSQASPDQVIQIVDALDKLGFFGIQGIFTAPGTSADTYHYQLTVERLGDSRTIDAEDGFIPPAMAQLFAQVQQLGS